MIAEVFIQTNNQLGEGPVWDHSRNELLWVDIEKKLLQFYRLNSGERTVFAFESRIGAAVPVENTNKYLLALQNGLALFNRDDQSLEYISDCESDLYSNRFNDGKCDPAGRFWIGSLDLQINVGKGSLYCLDLRFSVSRKLSGLTIPNGMAWTDDDKTMYFTDTASRCVKQFDFEYETGAISNGKTVITVPEKLGWPDGMCIDREGMLWIANWGASCITRWNPYKGEMVDRVTVPAINVSSVCFGGENLDLLFITSARTGLTADELEKYPLSGSVFTYIPDVSGLKSIHFRIEK